MTNCPNCGAPIEKHSDKCSYCGTPYQNISEKKKRKCGDGCKGCMYRKRYGADIIGFCDYIGETGKPRGCPAGEGCIRYERTAKKSERKNLVLRG